MREILNRTVSDVKEFQEGHINSNATMLTLHKNLERVHGIASSVQKDLKLTNALVLPNISPDSGAGNMSKTRTPSPLESNIMSLYMLSLQRGNILQEALTFEFFGMTHLTHPGLCGALVHASLC